MKKILVIFILLLSFNTVKVNAENYYNSSSDYYTSEGKIKVDSLWYKYLQNEVYTAEIWKLERVLPKINFGGADGKSVTGSMNYTNYSEQTTGNFDLKWTFVPDNSNYESKYGVFHFYLLAPDTEKSKGKIDDTIISEPTTLTATTLMLASSSSTYDINLVNKDSNATYKWTSSDEKVAKVNKSGVVTSVSDEGSCIITCKITSSDGTVQELISTVQVGQDDNYPILSEEDLTISISDTIDLNVENLVKGSTVKFKSSDKTVAKVSSKSGLVTGVNEGICQVIATITKDKEVTVLVCNVEITE